jgi:hypothetical protein
MTTADAVRATALGLPEAAERETWGHPTFRIGEKMFMGMASDGTTVSVKASKEAQAACVGSDPETFFVPKYVGQHGWIGVVLERVDPEEMRELVVEAWLLTAPKRLTKDFDLRSAP